MEKNINTKEYWDRRFGSGNWEEIGGGNQTTDHMLMALPHFSIPNNFSGLIMDFGCALGEAVPILRQAFPAAKILGMDISENAIQACQKNYSEIAEFQAGDVSTAPNVDIIITAHVMEHLSDDRTIVLSLLDKCKELYVIVPYNEDITNMFEEHVNSYTENYYNSIPGLMGHTVTRAQPFTLKRFLMQLYHIHTKNCLKFLLGRKLAKSYKQIIFHFKSDSYK